MYDLTNFAGDHPGGIDILKDCAGTDGTEAYDYAGHNEDSVVTLQRFRVGVLKGLSDRTNLPSTSSNASQIAEMEAKENLQNPGGHVSALPASMGSKTHNSWFSFMLVVVGLCCGVLGASATIKLYSSNTRVDRNVASRMSAYSGLTTFIAGACVAWVCSLGAMAAVYPLFSRTLRQEKEVFEYPSVIEVRS